jgi:hypothetical protein
MIRRDSEKHHDYSTEVFESLRIYDIQGILKEGDQYNCGVEAYIVEDFTKIDFQSLNKRYELARYFFCEQLGIPYYIIIVSREAHQYRIYKTNVVEFSISFEMLHEFTVQQFLDWWKSKQSFEQKKIMYDANARLKDNIIDQDLFGNALAWGVNVDGFSFNTETRKINAIYEKRICTAKGNYTVKNYDPNKFFFGTQNRSGDYPAWNILDALSKKMNIPLVLLTFDTSETKIIGASKITNISSEKGITYLNDTKPFQNLFIDNIENLKVVKNCVVILSVSSLSAVERRSAFFILITSI